jgi:hypothetical protein
VSPLSFAVKSCSRCGSVRYCSRECQAADWQAFHKGAECKAIAKQTTTTTGGPPTAATAESRDALIRHPEVVTPRLPFEIKLDAWEGDQLCVYLYNVNDDGSIGPKTSPCDLGWHIMPKERWAFEKMKFSYAAPTENTEQEAAR